MIGKLHIDGFDAFEVFGLFILKNGYENLLSFPRFKKLESNDWFEEDGLEVDLSNPVFEPNEFSIEFGFVGSYARFIELRNFLNESTYKVFSFTEIERNFILRVSNTNDLKFYQDLAFITLSLVDDFPIQRMNYLNNSLFPEIASGTIPSFQAGYDLLESNWTGSTIPTGYSTSLNIGVTGFEIDGVDLSEYGIIPLKGSIDDFRVFNAKKLNLSISTDFKNGQLYDSYSLGKFQNKRAKINLLLRSDSFEELWKNFDCFMYNLTKANERELGISITKQTYKCFYESCNISGIYLDGRKWLIFTVGLVVNSWIDNFTSNYGALSTENDIYLTNESDQYIQIGESFLTDI